MESKPTSHEAIPPIRRVLTETPGTVIRVMVMSLANVIPVTTTVFGASLATQKDYGIGWHADVFLWIPVLGNLAAVLIIPAAAAASDRVGRRPLLIGGTLTSGVLSFASLWAIGRESILLIIVLALVMRGTLYQGYDAVFPSFFPEQFPTSSRVMGMAIGQNLGTALSSLMAMASRGCARPEPPSASSSPSSAGSPSARPASSPWRRGARRRRADCAPTPSVSPGRGP